MKSGAGAARIRLIREGAAPREPRPLGRKGATVSRLSARAAFAGGAAMPAPRRPAHPLCQFSRRLHATRLEGSASISSPGVRLEENGARGRHQMLMLAPGIDRLDRPD